MLKHTSDQIRLDNNGIDDTVLDLSQSNISRSFMDENSNQATPRGAQNQKMFSNYSMSQKNNTSPPPQGADVDDEVRLPTGKFGTT